MSEDEKDNKLKVLQGNNNLDIFREIIRTMSQNLPLFRENAFLLIEYNEIDAKIKREKFKSLVKEGFTEAQALELCK